MRAPFTALLFAALVTLCGPAAATVISSVSIGVTATAGPSDTTFQISSANLAVGPLSGIYESVLTIEGTLVDTGRDGVTLSSDGPNLIAQALIEGGVVVDLFGGATAAGLIGPLSVSALINSGDFGGTIDSLQAVMRFRLSANDQVTLTVTHTIQTVEQVPEPAALLLFGIGLAGLGALRRSAAAKSTVA